MPYILTLKPQEFWEITPGVEENHNKISQFINILEKYSPLNVDQAQQHRIVLGQIRAKLLPWFQTLLASQPAAYIMVVGEWSMLRRGGGFKGKLLIQCVSAIVPGGNMNVLFCSRNDSGGYQFYPLESVPVTGQAVLINTGNGAMDRHNGMPAAALGAALADSEAATVRLGTPASEAATVRLGTPASEAATMRMGTPATEAATVRIMRLGTPASEAATVRLGTPATEAATVRISQVQSRMASHAQQARKGTMQIGGHRKGSEPVQIGAHRKS